MVIEFMSVSRSFPNYDNAFNFVIKNAFLKLCAFIKLTLCVLIRCVFQQKPLLIPSIYVHACTAIKNKFAIRLETGVEAQE